MKNGRPCKTGFRWHLCMHHTIKLMINLLQVCTGQALLLHNFNVYNKLEVYFSDKQYKQYTDSADSPCGYKLNLLLRITQRNYVELCDIWTK